MPRHGAPKHVAPKQPGYFARRAQRRALMDGLVSAVAAALDATDKPLGSPQLNGWVRARADRFELGRALSTVPAVAQLKPSGLSKGGWYTVLGRVAAREHRLVLSVNCYERV